MAAQRVAGGGKGPVVGFLGPGVGDLKCVGTGQDGERRRDPAGRPRSNDEAAEEGGGDPHAQAIGADQQLAHREAQAVATRRFVDLGVTGVALKGREGARTALVTRSRATIREVLWVASASRARSPSAGRSGNSRPECRIQAAKPPHRARNVPVRSA